MKLLHNDSDINKHTPYLELFIDDHQKTLPLMRAYRFLEPCVEYNIITSRERFERREKTERERERESEE